jgi:hypothetical protein
MSFLKFCIRLFQNFELHSQVINFSFVACAHATKLRFVFFLILNFVLAGIFLFLQRQFVKHIFHLLKIYFQDLKFTCILSFDLIYFCLFICVSSL